MRLRDVFARWLGSDEPAPPRRRPLPGPARSDETTVLPKVTAEVIDDTPDPAGTLVVGDAELRTAEVPMPQFYVPQPEPIRPYSDPELLTRHTDYDPAALRDAWSLVADRSDQLVVTFYAELFVRLKEAPQMFPSSMEQQRKDFGRTLVQWVVADDPAMMVAHLEQLGADHRKYDVEPRHYETAGAALVSAWRATVGEAKWTTRHEAAVLGSYTRLASVMLDGATRNLHEPASWGAHVIGHQKILRDFAVLTVQPDEPYPYKAGQYLTLEIPSHRRQWRQMSIASAPRADNSFDIHVRAIGGLGVSAGLVNRTSVGDRLRLGPPRGNNLVVEPGTVSDGLLCIASGTGSAPISAVVESVLAWREPPAQLDVFIGGRTSSDIYAVDALNDLIRSRGRWQVARAHGVVDEPGYVGYRGRVEKVVPTLRDWASLGVDVLVAGPNPMIETTVANLRMARVPRGKIRFDQYELAA